MAEPLIRYRQHGGGIHLNIPKMEKSMLIALEKAFASPDAWAGTAVAATVKAQDSFGHTLTTYAGTIAFTSSAGQQNDKNIVEFQWPAQRRR